MCAQRALGIIALVLTEVCLGQGHGERSLGVDLKEIHNTKYEFRTIAMVFYSHTSMDSGRPVMYKHAGCQQKVAVSPNSVEICNFFPLTG